MILGIVGEAGVGKTAAADFFAKKAAVVISADLIVRDIYQKQAIKDQIFQEFGQQFFDNHKTLNKVALRAAAFLDYQVLKKLEAIIWPEMIAIITSKLKTQRSEKLIVLDCAVLFNAKLDHLVDKVLLVVADEDKKINRIKVRDKVSSEQAKALLAIQKQHLILQQNIDFVVKNNGSLVDFNLALTNLMTKLIK